ncbi:MAG: hypothetical protein II198_01435, partial [Bacteroidaceae bacterium]|nr:hypothetical protein [Bacteroidaceae bacterium]
MKKLLCLLAVVAVAVGCTPDDDFTLAPGLDNSIPSDSISSDSVSGDAVSQDFFASCPNNEIRYIADDSLEVDFAKSIFINDIKLAEHTFVDGYGTFKFNGDVMNVPSWAFNTLSSLRAVCLPASVTFIGT